MNLRSVFALALALAATPALAQVNPGTSPLSGAKGGTNNGFMQFTGPATSMKTFTLPNASDTLAALGQIQTWTGAQSFGDGKLILLGATSGASTLKAPATGGGTATLFPGTDTIAGLAAAQALTNKTFNCANNTCTVRLASDVTGQLPIANGGCNAATATNCFNNVAPTPTRTGDIIYWNGTSYVTLPGNNAGTQVLQETAGGLPSWATVSGTGTVTTLTAGAGIQFSSGATCTNTCTVSLTKIPYKTRATASFTTDATSTTSTVYTGYLTGGGGGGGGSGVSASAASGGGAGGTCSFQFSGVAPSTAVTISLGAAGTAGATTPTNGGAGGSSTIAATGITTITATGGSGGSSASVTVGSVGPGGSCTTGTTIVSITGGTGNLGVSNTGNGQGGLGGASFWGGGGSSGNASAGGTGGSGAALGSGGGGGAGANVAGGVGAAGAALVEWISIQ